MTIERPARLLCGAAALMTALLLDGCNHPGVQSSSGPIAGLPAVMATVNGDPISSDDYVIELMGYQSGQGPASTAPAGRVVLAQMIQDRLIEQFAAKQNVTPTPDQIDAQYNDTVLEHNSQSPLPMDKVLGQSFMTADLYKRLRVLPQLAQFNLLTQGLSVMDSEKQAYYGQSMDHFVESDRAHIKRIAFQTQVQAGGAYDQIKSGQKNFEDFIPQSVVQNPPDADLPNWIPTNAAKNAQIAPLCKAITATAIGQTSQPFFFQHGWWLVKVVDKQPAVTLPESQVDHLIATLLLTQKAEDPDRIAKLQQDLKTYESAAQITINVPDYADISASIKSMASAPTPQNPGAPAQ